MDCEVVRKSAITGNIWNTGSKPYWLHALFPLLVKEKRKKIQVLGSVLMFIWINSYQSAKHFWEMRKGQNGNSKNKIARKGNIKVRYNLVIVC